MEVEQEAETHASFSHSVIVLDVVGDKMFTGAKRNSTGMPVEWFRAHNSKTLQPLDDSLDCWREGAVVIRQTLGWSSYLTRGRAALNLTPHFSLLWHQMTAKVATRPPKTHTQRQVFEGRPIFMGNLRRAESLCALLPMHTI